MEQFGVVRAFLRGAVVVDTLAEEASELLALIWRELGGDQKLSEIPVEIGGIADEV
ncbi:MAG: hypothetical protein WEB29_00060 [Chloroflexota bacterium]